jgi:hypothetical protein
MEPGSALKGLLGRAPGHAEQVVADQDFQPAPSRSAGVSVCAHAMWSDVAVNDFPDAQRGIYLAFDVCGRLSISQSVVVVEFPPRD